ncbi:DnaJ domain containing protein [Nitzschia inconspicua]|uniref:DnaJ domain containing protein n=1 Tax=Nitzschia inconspicua TaxID=303405 RepID=A0A9K3KN44_9STRA|nr:DnaJ domain containing protein [Nitzschia inconspicua]
MSFFSFNNRASSNCFDRLGISPDSTEEEIKKAYRRLAIQTHPDKVPQDQVEQATIAFRELHEAYQECLSKCGNKNSHFDSTASSCSRNQPSRRSSSRRSQQHGKDGGAYYSHRRNHNKRNKRHNQRRRSAYSNDQKSDEDIKKTFNDVCEEIDREIDKRLNADWLKCLEEVQAAWPDKDECWKVVDRSLLRTNIPKLAREMKPLNPLLANFLVEKKSQWDRDFDRRSKQQIRDNLECVERLWRDNRKGLKKWVQSSDLFCWDWEDTIKLISDQQIADTIKKWRKEFMDLRDEMRSKDKKEAAEKIVKVFPDRQMIKKILNKFLSWRRREIYDLLPEHIRTELVIYQDDNQVAIDDSKSVGFPIISY